MIPEPTRVVAFRNRDGRGTMTIMTPDTTPAPLPLTVDFTGL
jgi:hypothetical protein